MARSEDHQHERDDKADDKKEAPARRAKSDAPTHEDLEALKAWVRQEIALAASGVPLEDRVARNT